MSENDSKIVTVIFRIWKHGTHKGNLTAYFPYLPAVPRERTITCYDMSGGHGSADYDYILPKTRLATPEEYDRLKKHLEEVVEYKLRVRQQVDRDKLSQSFRDYL